MDFKISKVLRFIASIIICLLAGIIGSIFTISQVNTWYLTLNKPFFNPPSWVFSPVWTTLFILMGVSLYIVWNEGIERRNIRHALYIFGVQLVLNVSWSAVFFGMENLLGGLIVIILLWITIFITIIRFKEISKAAAYLLIPYIVWVTFAGLLNLVIWMIN